MENVIRLDYDVDEATRGAARFNNEQKKIESQARRNSETVVRFTDRSRQSIERLVASAEKKATFSGLDPLQRLNAERAQLLKRIGNEPAAIGRVNQAYDTMVAKQRTLSASTTGFRGVVGNLTSELSGLAAGLSAVAAAKFIGKDVILDSALYATRLEQLGGALEAVAKSNDIFAGAARGYERELKQLGITTEATRQSLALMISNELPLEGAGRLARTAQDTGRVIGKDSSETLEQLIHAITTLQPEMFRTLQLTVDLEGAYKRVAAEQGRTVLSLTETEKRQIAMNAALQAGTAYAGVYEKGLETAGGRILSLNRYLLDAKAGLGQEFLPELNLVVGGLYQLGKVGEEAGHKTGEAIRQMAVNAAPGLAVLGKFLDYRAAIYDTDENNAGFADRIKADIAEFQRLTILGMGGSKMIDEEQARRDKQSETDAETAKKAQEDRIQQIQRAQEQAHDQLRRAQLDELDGVARITAEYRDQLKVLGLSAQARRDLGQAAILRANREARQSAEETRTLLSSAAAEFSSQSAENAAANAAIEQAALDKRNQTVFEGIRKGQEYQQQLLDVRIQRELQGAGQVRDAQIRALEATGAQTVQQQVAVENERARITEQYLLNVGKLEAAAIERRYERELRSLEVLHEAKLISERSYQSQRAVLSKVSEEEIDALSAATVAEITGAREDAQIKSNQIIQDSNEDLFNRFKTQGEQTFDALVSAARGGADSFKRIWLAALKDIISSQFAKLMFQLSGGGSVSLAGAGGSGNGGLLGKIGGLVGLGAVPAFGSAGAPGGTGGFAGPVGLQNALSLGGTAAAAAGTPGFATSGGFAQAGLLGSLGTGGFLSQLGNLGAGTGHLAKGITGNVGGGLLIGGGALVADGIRRGGLAGLGETTAGGALIGAKFGGPIGALVGAGVGSIIGVIGLFRSRAEDKVVKRVRDLYGITLDKKYAKDPLLGIIKNQFGGNIDVGLRSPAVRELIELYAMSTGQNSGGLGLARATPAVFTNRGGVLTQSPTFQNGVPVLAGAPGSNSGAAGSGNINVQLDPAATVQFLEGRQVSAIRNNPRTVTKANLEGNRRSVGTREGLGAVLNPSFVTS